MKYCPECKCIHNDSAELCENCNKTLVVAEEASIVSVTSVKGSAVNIIEPVLKEKGIPCSFENTEGNVYNTYNLKVKSESVYRVLVPFEYYTEAFDVLLAMDIVSEDERQVDPADNIEKESGTYQEKFERANGVKHHTFTFIWVILFIVVACLAVWGIDFIAAVIKDYFINGGADATETTATAIMHFLPFLH